jgi:DNA-binding cell septation regulator SpoVG
MRKAAGKDHGVCVCEACVPVPNELGVLAEHVLDGVIGIVVAIGSGKHNDGEFHGYLKPLAPAAEAVGPTRR